MEFNDKYDKGSFEGLFELWGKRNPSYEAHYDDDVIKYLTDFGKGTNTASDAKGKVLGAGYEVLIMAFFIGLYSDRKLPIDEDENTKVLGQPIQYWGNLDSKKGRKAYSRLRDYIFIALVAKTPDIDWLEVDKGKWTPAETVNLLMDTMEQYINYGLTVILGKLKEDEGYFVNKDSFLRIFEQLTGQLKEDEEDDDEPESLD
jgi:hypothetical protein